MAETELKRERKLPDPDVCRTEFHPSIADFMHCRTPAPSLCPFVVPFGQGFFCCHPMRERFTIMGRH